MALVRRRNAVRLGLPTLVVAVLAGIALWRVGPPPDPAPTVATSGGVAPYAVDTPLSRVVDLLAANAVGRQASLEHVEVQDVVGHGAFWAGVRGERPVFAVVGPDMAPSGVDVQPGREVTLIGVVRAAPTEEEAGRMWHLDAATARAVREAGTYLDVREIRQEGAVFADSASGTKR